MMAIAAQPVELVITRETWDAALRPLLLEPGGVAVGALRCNMSATARELLVDRLDIVHGLPGGDQRPPLDDWVVLRVEASVDGTEPPAELIARLRPRPSQTLVVVTVLRGEQRQAWDGAVYENGHTQQNSRRNSLARLRLRPMDRVIIKADIAVRKLTLADRCT